MGHPFHSFHRRRATGIPDESKHWSQQEDHPYMTVDDKTSAQFVPDKIERLREVDMVTEPNLLPEVNGDNGTEERQAEVCTVENIEALVEPPESSVVLVPEEIGHLVEDDNVAGPSHQPQAALRGTPNETAHKTSNKSKSDSARRSVKRRSDEDEAGPSRRNRHANGGAAPIVPNPHLPERQDNGEAPPALPGRQLPDLYADGFTWNKNNVLYKDRNFTVRLKIFISVSFLR